MSTLLEYTKQLRSRGEQMFSTEDVMHALGASRSQVLNMISISKRKGEIASPFQGLYVPISAENRWIGCLPSDELVPLLMERLKTNYYVAFLSAAKYHGASHQKPMIFQVVCEKRMKNIVCGHVRIWFSYKKDVSKIPVQKRVVTTGYLNVSTPEATAMDIINYPKHSIGINNIATVLSELIEEIDVPKLIEMADISGQKAWIQRMGYILENIDTMAEKHKKNIIYALKKYLSNKKTFYMPLSSVNPKSGFSRDKKWKIIENTTVDSDL